MAAEKTRDLPKKDKRNKLNYTVSHQIEITVGNFVYLHPVCLLLDEQHVSSG